MRPARKALTQYKVLVRFTRLEPVEDYLEYRVQAENAECAEKHVLREFWKARSDEPQPAVEIDHINVTQA